MKQVGSTKPGKINLPAASYDLGAGRRGQRLGPIRVMVSPSQ